VRYPFSMNHAGGCSLLFVLGGVLSGNGHRVACHRFGHRGMTDLLVEIGGTAFAYPGREPQGVVHGGVS